MMNSVSAVTAITTDLRSEYSPLWVRVNNDTGLLTEVGSDATGSSVSVDCGATFQLGGHERRGALGGLVYDDVVTKADLTATGPFTSRVVRDGRVFTVPVTLGGWEGELSYTFRTASPGLTWTWRWRPGAATLPLRNFQMSLAFQLAARSTVNIPGNRLRANLPLHDLSSGTSVNSFAGGAGSAGLFAFSDLQEHATLTVWPRSKDELWKSLISNTDDGAMIVVSTNVAAAATPATDLMVDGIAVDLQPGLWSDIRGEVRSWYADLNIRTPDDRPEWTGNATIYEAQIGTSLFAGGAQTYSPYPDVTALYADLPRIAGMGFNTIQLMPRQPFPSYNVIDYDDIDITYGNEQELHRVVEWCHAHGLRLILDVLMHGVIDKESIGEVADAVRNGPWAELARAGADEVKARQLTIAEQADLSWSRHILDFEAAWRDGSPTRHPLTEEHPEWFSTDTSGNIIGVYTKAFDISNPEWQAYFSDAMVRLVDRLGIDGFRFDAPGYNRFPNWSPRTAARASLQQLGGLALFARLRGILHDRDPQLMMYTEESGPLWRASMDINYNYDETWLPDSLFGAGGDNPASRVRHGRDLADWLADRDLTLPAGSLTAHHIDSHDTFWWPLPGLKWRREQFGIEATRALMTAFALSGGPYMMFVGGEDGMEETVEAVNSIRATRPEIFCASPQYGIPRADTDQIYSVTHRRAGNQSILLVNMSPLPTNARFEASDELPSRWNDLLVGNEVLHLDQAIVFAPYQSRFLIADE